jgi:hypothetical protein
MDEQLLGLLEDINTALTKYITKTKGVSSKSVEDVVEVVVAAVPELPRELHRRLEDPAPPAVEETEVVEAPVESGPAGEFPFTAKQVMTMKRKQLREAIGQFNLPVTGPNGESSEEMLVGPLREALCTYIRMQEMNKVISSEPTEAAEVVSDEVEKAVVEPVVVEPVVVPEIPPLNVVAEPVVVEPQTEGTSKMGVRAQQFLTWVMKECGGSLDAPDTAVQATKAEELGGFFEANLPYVHGKDREPLDQYFEKMGCEANCKSCPHSVAQAVFCYGVFDEEVSSISLKDAVEDDQFFVVTETGSFEHQPTF